jgi:hypothetical protein
MMDERFVWFQAGAVTLSVQPLATLPPCPFVAVGVVWRSQLPACLYKVLFSSSNLKCQIHCSDTVAFRLYLVIIIQPLTNEAQNVRLAKYN